MKIYEDRKEAENMLARFAEQIGAMLRIDEPDWGALEANARVLADAISGAIATTVIVRWDRAIEETSK